MNHQDKLTWILYKSVTQTNQFYSFFTSDAPINENWPWNVPNSCSPRYHLMYTAKNFISSHSLIPIILLRRMLQLLKASKYNSANIVQLISLNYVTKSARLRLFWLVLQLHNGFLYSNFSQKFINNCSINQKQVWSKCINIVLD